MQSRDWRRVRRVLVVRTDDPAGVLLLGPALRALKGALPGAEVTLLTSPEGSLAAPLLPWVDDAIPYRAIWQDTIGEEPVDVEAQVDLIDVLQRRGFDAALVFTRAGVSPWPAAYITYLAGIRLRIGQSTEEGGGLLTHVVTPLPADAHQVDRNLHLLESSGLPAAGRRLELAVPEQADAAAEGVLLRSRIPPGEPFVVLAPGGDGRGRRYPNDRAAEVCRAIADRTGLPVVIVGTRLDIAAGAEIAAAANRPGVSSVAGQTALPELAAVVRRSACVITSGAVVMHVADAFRRPLVVLDAGAEHEATWEPRGAPATVLRRPTPCAPDRGKACPHDGECVDLRANLVANEAIARIGSVAGWEPTSSAATLALTRATGPSPRPPAAPPPGVVIRAGSADGPQPAPARAGAGTGTGTGTGTAVRPPAASRDNERTVVGEPDRPRAGQWPATDTVDRPITPRALPPAGGGPADRYGEGAGPAWQEET